MADISVTPKQGGSKTWMWAVLAIACVLGLMLWLGVQEEPTPPTPITNTDTAAVEAPMATDTVSGGAVADTTGVAQ